MENTGRVLIELVLYLNSWQIYLNFPLLLLNSWDNIYVHCDLCKYYKLTFSYLFFPLYFINYNLFDRQMIIRKDNLTLVGYTLRL